MTKLPLLICSLVLFIVPFFWMLPGEMNLGGDSSRLYFFDPQNYLVNIAFFAVNPWESGSVMISFFYIPFVTLLLIIKIIVSSASLLINVFNSMSMVIGFICVYAFILRLLSPTKHSLIREFAAIAGGLFYILTPVLGTNWDKALITYNQLFLNPLMSYLLLLLIVRNSLFYGLLAVFISFVFAPNFSFTSAPPFFAFYPLVLVFVISYTSFILKKRIPSGKLLICLALFLAVHFFHIFPQGLLFIDSSSEEHTRAISEEGISQAANQFAAVLPYVKLSNNLMSLPQLKLISRPEIYSSRVDFVFVYFIFIVTAGLAVKTYYQRDRITVSFLLTMIFFLFALFLMTGTITNTGVGIYHSLFQIPGFGMFRNFVGQFAPVVFYFYAFVFAIGLYAVLIFVKRQMRVVVGVLTILIIIFNGRQVLTGQMVNLPIYGATGTTVPFMMDPSFQEVLDFLKNEPVDGRILTLPLNDYSYQILSGKEKGMYIGPSMIGGLSGKNDYTSYRGFASYSDELLQAFKDRDYPVIKTILKQFNISHIYHNEDEQIVERQYFPAFPYEYVRLFMPADQAGYKKMLTELGFDKVRTFGNHSIYRVNDNNFLPHIYAANKLSYLNTEDMLLYALLDTQKSGQILAHYYSDEVEETYHPFIANYYIEAEKKSAYLDFFNHRRGSAYATPYPVHMPSSRVFPLILLKEKKELHTMLANDFDGYYDYAYFLAEKRIHELSRWKENYEVRENIQTLEQLDMLTRETAGIRSIVFPKRIYWEDRLAHYRSILLGLIHDIGKTDSSAYSPEMNKINLMEKLTYHYNLFYQTVQTAPLSQDKQLYLMHLVQKMFEDFTIRLNVDIPDDTAIPYVVDTVPSPGLYEVYVEGGHIEDRSNETVRVSMNGKLLHSQNVQEKEGWIRYDDVSLESGEKATINVEYSARQNLLEGVESWRSPLDVQTKQGESHVIADNSTGLDGGVIREVLGIHPSAVYVLTFDYKTNDIPFTFRLHERGADAVYSTLHQRSLMSGAWQTYKHVVQPGKNAQDLILHLTKNDKEGQGTAENKIDIRNMSLIKIPHPKIILVRKTPSGDQTIPVISFQRINPAKYTVNISHASEPFILVFLEHFNNGWKVYRSDSRLPNTETVARHLGGLVHEKRALDTLFQFNKDRTPLARDFHFQANGYANGWYITPGDVDNQTEYTLTIELAKQYEFFWAWWISIGALILTLSLLLINGIMRIRKIRYHARV